MPKLNQSYRPALALLVFLVALLLAKPGRAERVVLVRPNRSDAQLTEAFHRLEGELRMLDFEAILATANELPTAEEMRRVAELGQASATVVLDRSNDEPIAHVWFMDRETNKPRILSIAVPPDDEAPALLALRTVELLRSSLRERAVTTEPPRVQSPSRSSSANRSSAPSTNNSASVNHFVLRSEGALAWLNWMHPPRTALALSLGYRWSSRFESNLRLLVPLGHNEVTVARASAEYRAESASADLRWIPLSLAASLELESVVAIGLSRWTVRGHSLDPALEDRTDRGWAWLVALGVGGSYPLISQWRFGIHARIGAMIPRPIVQVDELSRPMGRPWAETSISVGYRF